MLRDLRRRAAEALATARRVVLSTSGPAGVQAESLVGEAIGLRLYLLLPRTSDLLFNVESDPRVVVTAEGWQLRGLGRVLGPGESPPGLALASDPDAPWCALVEIQPTRLYLRSSPDSGGVETIDV